MTDFWLGVVQSLPGVAFAYWLGYRQAKSDAVWDAQDKATRNLLDVYGIDHD